MALFQRNSQTLSLIKSTNFTNEKDLQTLIERNLGVVFDCRFVASEFPTGANHGGRIDTLALSEDNSPVIIEYKKVESSELINQSLYYLSWIQDHRGDFQVAVNKALGKNIQVDWSDVRVICIAPGYKKYDLHAVKMMGANIELWQYHLYSNGFFSLEQVFGGDESIGEYSESDSGSKNPVMVAAGKKAAQTRATGSYTFDAHFAHADNDTQSIVRALQDYILALDDAVTQVPKKFYVAYKVAQNFVCMEIKKSKVILFLKLNPTMVKPLPENARDVTNIGHYGTGDLEYTISNVKQLETAYALIKQAFENVGG